MRDDGDDRLDEDDPRPLWQQLAGLLRGRIERGELAGRLEAETALAQHYGVSRDTVRRALADLAPDGLIRSKKEQKAGIVVAGVALLAIIGLATGGGKETPTDSTSPIASASAAIATTVHPSWTVMASA